MNIDEFCAGCGRKMFLAKTGQEVLELTEKGRPYKLMTGDVLECPECHCLVVTRFGEVTPRHDPRFTEAVQKARIAKALEVV